MEGRRQRNAKETRIKSDKNNQMAVKSPKSSIYAQNVDVQIVHIVLQISKKSKYRSCEPLVKDTLSFPLKCLKYIFI